MAIEPSLLKLGSFELSRNYIPINVRLMLIAIGDIVVITLATLLCLFILGSYFETEFAQSTMLINYLISIVISIEWYLLALANDLYDFRHSFDGQTLIAKLFQLQIQLTFINLVIFLLIFPIWWILAFIAITTYVLIVWRSLITPLIRTYTSPVQFIIIGNSQTANAITETLLQSSTDIYSLYGTYNHKIFRRYDENNNSISEQLPNLNELSKTQGLFVIGASGNKNGDFDNLLQEFRSHNIPIIHMVDMYLHLTSRFPIEYIDEFDEKQWLRVQSKSMTYKILSRMLDLAISLVGLLILALVAPIVAILIKLESEGPVFFNQPRIGCDGKHFTIYKFRTMVKNKGNVLTSKNDARITRFGNFLRKTRIDELPQFFNVLRGEMSIVGPRPDPLFNGMRYEKNVEYYKFRSLVKPGLTGWGHGEYGYVITDEEARYRLGYDIAYVLRENIWLDLVTIWRTIGNVISLGGH